VDEVRWWGGGDGAAGGGGGDGGGGGGCRLHGAGGGCGWLIEPCGLFWVTRPGLSDRGYFIPYYS
jgi:hypothetical protein